ncbi:hypothetical protein [Fluviicola sp.]|uniref:hypothetical protein n=1 Tax=Fluviicola sp. TaxID=1917219 RepID=UPI0031D7402D
MKNVTLQNVVFIVSLIIYFYIPLFGLVLLAFSTGWFLLEISRKRTKLTWALAALSGIGVFLLLQDYSAKRQAKILVAEVFDYYRHHHKTPDDLGDVSASGKLMTTAAFGNFDYEHQILSEHRCEWKLEFTNIWGTGYFYDDGTGRFEKILPGQGTSRHWNLFWKAEPHLRTAEL